MAELRIHCLEFLIQTPSPSPPLNRNRKSSRTATWRSWCGSWPSTATWRRRSKSRWGLAGSPTPPTGSSASGRSRESGLCSPLVTPFNQPNDWLEQLEPKAIHASLPSFLQGEGGTGRQRGAGGGRQERQPPVQE